MRDPLWVDEKIREEARNIARSRDKRWMAESVLEGMRTDYQKRIDELEDACEEEEVGMEESLYSDETIETIAKRSALSDASRLVVAEHIATELRKMKRTYENYIGGLQEAYDDLEGRYEDLESAYQNAYMFGVADEQAADCDRVDRITELERQEDKLLNRVAELKAQLHEQDLRSGQEIHAAYIQGKQEGSEWIPIEDKEYVHCNCGSEQCSLRVVQNFGSLYVESEQPDHGVNVDIDLEENVRMCRWKG